MGYHVEFLAWSYV